MGRDAILSVDAGGGDGRPWTTWLSCCLGVGRSAATESAGRAGRIPCHKSKPKPSLETIERDRSGGSDRHPQMAHGRLALPRCAFPRRPNRGWPSIQESNAGRIIVNHRFCTYIHGLFRGRRGRRAAVAAAVGRRCVDGRINKTHRPRK
jgi:hypothetical protein